MQPFVPYQTIHIVAPTPTIKPTRVPDPTWTSVDKGHLCRALAALSTAEAEGNAAYSDAKAGRWTQVLTHAKRVDLQSQVAGEEFGAVSATLWGRAVSALASNAEDLAQEGASVVFDINLGLYDVMDVMPMYSVGPDYDLEDLRSALGGCPEPVVP